MEAPTRRVLLKHIADALFAVAALASLPANAQTKPGECRFVLELPTTRLYVDKGWLDQLDPPLNGGICPTQPVKVSGVYFGREVLNVLGIGNGVGQRWFRLYLRPVSDATAIATPSDPVWRQAVDASIQMQLISPNSPGFHDARFYKISYRSSSKPLSGEVRVSCGGEQPKQRYCSVAPLPHFAGVVIQYEFNQSNLPVPFVAATSPETEPGSIDSSSEPGAVLLFDRRLRAWLIDLERPR